MSASLHGVTVTNGTDTTAQPVVEVGGEAAPADLAKLDLVVGEGPAATPSDTVHVHYHGAHFTDGTEFDSSWSRGAPTSFPLNGVVAGFRDGISGMKVGGRALLVVPPKDGYGSRGAPPVIGPNETLVFVVDLLSIH